MPLFRATIPSSSYRRTLKTSRGTLSSLALSISQTLHIPYFSLVSMSFLFDISAACLGALFPHCLYQYASFASQSVCSGSSRRGIQASTLSVSLMRHRIALCICWAPAAQLCHSYPHFHIRQAKGKQSLGNTDGERDLRLYCVIITQNPASASLSKVGTWYRPSMRWKSVRWQRHLPGGLSIHRGRRRQ